VTVSTVAVEQCDEPDDAVVDATHKRYFAALVALFE
jgi:hypothetical protein